MHKTSVQQIFNKTDIIDFFKEEGLWLASLIVALFFFKNGRYWLPSGLIGIAIFRASRKKKRRIDSLATKVWALAAKLNLTVDDLSQLTTIGKYDLAAAKRNEYQPPEEEMKRLVQKLEYLAKQQE